jgi:prevent-host-death family protein
MKKVPVTELKNKLSHYLRLVKRGETVEILERSVPVAHIVSVQGKLSEGDGALRQLVREGIVAAASRKPSRDFLDEPPLRSRLDPVKALVEERGGR